MAAFRYPWQAEPVPVALSPLPDPEEPPRKRRGRRAASIIPAAAAAATPNWLYYHLTISGPAETVAAFAVAARGSGVVPWQLDFTALEEEVFVRAVAQPASRRNLTIDGCRILARQFRERVEARQARAAALVGRSDACPFDLHTLLPVPAAILQLGPTHPDARMWLTTQWGITDRLRQVVARPKPRIGPLRTPGRGRPSKCHAMVGYGFFTDGETPHPAMVHLGARWPALRFFLVPRPDA
jgi:hypothetical protein